MCCTLHSGVDSYRNNNQLGATAHSTAADQSQQAGICGVMSSLTAAREPQSVWIASGSPSSSSSSAAAVDHSLHQIDHRSSSFSSAPVISALSGRGGWAHSLRDDITTELVLGDWLPLATAPPKHARSVQSHEGSRD